MAAPLTSIFSGSSFVYDGDGKRVKSVMTTDVGTSTTYFVNNYYEVTNGVVTKYYYAGAQRIAMRKNGTLNYILGDHLGSTSIVTDAAGALVSQQLYTPWGETRFSSGLSPTQYQYTGQYSHTADFGLMFYNARWYDPALGRFAQADSIVSGGVQGLDRYAYVNNNPMRYTDPTGHMCSDPDDESGFCEGRGGKVSSNYAANWYRTSLKDRYNWNVASDFLENELKTIRQTAYDIESYVDGLTGGMGQDWMNTYLGNTNFIHTTGNTHQSLPGSWVGGNNTIKLISGKYNEQIIAHELGHTWDINSGRPGLGAINGPGDWLNTFVNGSIVGSGYPRFLNRDGKAADSHIPATTTFGGVEVQVQFDIVPGNNYGNGSTADYLAESFSWNVVNPGNVPRIASIWVDVAIMAQAQSLP